MRAVLAVLAVLLLGAAIAFGSYLPLTLRVTEAQNAVCRKAEFDRADWHVCSWDEEGWLCLCCVDESGMPQPFENKTE